METVGIRDLKAHLSRHLGRVRAGTRLVVTDRGRSIATIAPIETEGEAGWARTLVAEGGARWDGGKPAGARRPVAVSARSVSSAVLEDRR